MDAQLEWLTGPAFVLLFPVWWAFVCWLIAVLDGWQKLANRYEDHQVPDDMHRVSSAKLAWSGYKNVLKIGSSPRGLHLAVIWLFRPGHRPMCVPWDQVEDLGTKKLIFLEMRRLRLAGGPVLSVLDSNWLSLQHRPAT